MPTISTIQIKLWIGDLYIANKLLEEQVSELEQENHDLKIRLKEFEDANKEVE